MHRTTTSLVSTTLALTLACGCGSSSATTPTADPATESTGAETTGASSATAEPAQTWWMEDVPVEDPQGLEASVSARGLRDGVTVTLGATALFPDGFGQNDLFEPTHPMHQHMQEPDVQWRFSLTRGPVEVVMSVPAGAANDWMMGPPNFVLHQQGRRWPSLVMLAPGRTASEVRGTVDIDGESRRPVVLASGGATVPVLFLRCPQARVDVTIDDGAVESAERLAMHVMPLLDSIQPGAHRLTFLSGARPDEPAVEQEGDEGGDETEGSEAEAAPEASPPPTVEAIVVVGETVVPMRVTLGAEPVSTTLSFHVP